MRPRRWTIVAVTSLIALGSAGTSAGQVAYVNDGVDKPLIVGHALIDDDATSGTFVVTQQFDAGRWTVPPDAIHTRTDLRCETGGVLGSAIAAQTGSTRIASGQTAASEIPTSFAIFTADYGNCDPYVEDFGQTFNLVIEIRIVAHEAGGSLIEGPPAGSGVAQLYTDSFVSVLACILDECEPPDPIPSECALGFVDTKGTPFCDEITWLVENAITNGCALDRFCPTETASRGQMAVFLDRWLDLPSPIGQDSFDDDNGHYAEGSIEAMVDAEITTGIGPRTFGPELAVTRGQVALFLARALSLPPQPGADSFADDDGHYAESAIESLVSAGITKGLGGGLFGPDIALSREQLAAFLFRAEQWKLGAG